MQPRTLASYSPPHISINGTNLNAVEYFTYLGSVISDDATVSKDLDNRLFKASSSFGIQGRCRSHPPVRCRGLGSLSEADQAT